MSNRVRYSWRGDNLASWLHPLCGGNDEMDDRGYRLKFPEVPEIKECAECFGDICPQCETFDCDACGGYCHAEHQQEFRDMMVCPTCLGIAFMHTAALRGEFRGCIYPATQSDAKAIAAMFPDDRAEMKEAA